MPSEYFELQKIAYLTELDILRNNVRELQQQLQRAYARIDQLNKSYEEAKNAK